MMLFGSRDYFGIELVPVEPTWERKGLSDQGPWAGLAVYLRGSCLTRVVEEKNNCLRNFIYVPLLPLASWLVENIRAIIFEESSAHFHSDVNLHEALSKWNEGETPPGYSPESWEDKRYEWYARHFWLAGAEGCQLPDLAFVKADERLWLSWSKPRFAGPRQLEFISAPDFNFIEWKVAWEVFNDFVAYVAAEMRQRRFSDPAWIGEKKPLENAAQCSASDFISFVAPSAGQLLQNLGIDAQAAPEGSLSLQALRDIEVNEDTEAEIRDGLSVLERENSPGTRAFSNLAQMRNAILKPRDLSPEKAGYDMARWLRNEAGIDGKPLDSDTLNDVLKKVATVIEVNGESGRNHSVMGMGSGNNGIIVLLRHARMKYSWAKRMELARALGHLLLDPSTSAGILGAGSSQSAQGPRRRRSGAFAAELLLPKTGIESFLQRRDPSKGSVFEEIMEKFGVGAQTAAYHLWNQGFLQAVEDRDALIEQFGSKQFGPTS
jgi:hypothetical protein